MTKKKRRLSNFALQNLDDVKTYLEALPPEAREWMRINYIEPELFQKFTENFPQKEKQRVWREAKQRANNVDCIGDFITYNSEVLDLLSFTIEHDSELDRKEAVQAFFASLDEK